MRLIDYLVRDAKLDGVVAHGPEVHAEAHGHDNDDHVRVDREDALPRPHGGCSPVRLRVAIAPREVCVLVVVHLVAKVCRDHVGVILVPVGEVDQAIYPLLLAILGDVPESLVLRVVAAPPGLRVVVVEDDHELRVRQSLHGEVKYLEPTHALHVRVCSHGGVSNHGVLDVRLRAVHHADAVKAQLHDAVHYLLQRQDLQAAHCMQCGVRAVPVDARPFDSLAPVVDDVPPGSAERDLGRLNEAGPSPLRGSGGTYENPEQGAEPSAARGRHGTRRNAGPKCQGPGLA
mmetsp:Transcript_74371/g.168464  ORF Transcript_74371/g.168464 Transcript_74371/m.168464 type:complete len:288 (-) Transcript_74371:2-865(-)